MVRVSTGRRQSVEGFPHFIAIMIVISCHYVSAQEAIDRQKLIETANVTTKGAADWYQRVAAKGTYAIYRAEAKSAEDALSGRYVGERTREAIGSIAKLNNMVHLLVDYGKPPLQVGPDIVTRVSYEVVASDTMQLRRNLPYGNMSGGVGVSRVEKDRPIDGWRDVCHPFAGQNSLTDLIDSYGPDFLKAVVESPDHQEFEITGITNGYDEQYLLRYWTKVDPPVLVRYQFRRRGNGSYFDQVTEFGDFATLERLQVPRTVRKVIRSEATPEPTETSLWHVEEWHSDDLGKSAVKEEDFAMAVLPGDEIRSITRAAYKSKVIGFRLHVGQLTPFDLNLAPPQVQRQ